MKKSYETPMVEKIKFNYRDQVVAASGGANSSGTDEQRSDIGGGCYTWEDLGKLVLDTLGVCQYIPGM